MIRAAIIAAVLAFPSPRMTHGRIGGERMTAPRAGVVRIGSPALFSLSASGGSLAYSGQTSATFDRDTAAYRKTGSGLELVAIDTPRVEPAGLLIEDGRTNYVIRNDDLTTGWTLNSCTIDDDSTTDPLGTTTADGVIGAASGGAHYPSQAMTTATGLHTVSCFATPGEESWTALQVTNSPNTAQYFNASTCTVGSTTIGSPTNATAEAIGSMCRVSFSATFTNASQNLNVLPGEGDGDVVYTGDGSTVDVSYWGCQISAGAFPGSPLLTAGASATMDDDDAFFGIPETDFANGGQITVTFTVPDADGHGVLSVLTIDDETDACNERAYLSIAADGDLTFITDSAAGTDCLVETTSEDYSDGTEHTAVVTWGTNTCTLTVDDTLKDTDSTVSPPDDLDMIRVGDSCGDGSELEGNIKSIEVLKL